MRSISSGSSPVSRETSSTLTGPLGAGEQVLGEAEGENAPRGRPFAAPRASDPRSRIRATTRACAAAAAVHRPRRTGTTPPAAQRFRVSPRPPSGAPPRSADMRSSPAMGLGASSRLAGISVQLEDGARHAAPAPPHRTDRRRRGPRRRPRPRPAPRPGAPRAAEDEQPCARPLGLLGADGARQRADHPGDRNRRPERRAWSSPSWPGSESGGRSGSEPARPSRGARRRRVGPRRAGDRRGRFRHLLRPRGGRRGRPDRALTSPCGKSSGQGRGVTVASFDLRPGPAEAARRRRGRRHADGRGPRPGPELEMAAAALL